jgi:hypothetical protein
MQKDQYVMLLIGYCYHRKLSKGVPNTNLCEQIKCTIFEYKNKILHVAYM